MNKESFKKFAVRTLGTTELEKGESLSICLVTAYGIIVGKATQITGNDLSAMEYSSVINQLIKTYEKLSKQEYPFEGDDGCITLYDVTIIKGVTEHIKMSHISVFYDQIIAISIGDNFSYDS